MITIYSRNAWRPAIQGPRGKFFMYTKSGPRAVNFRAMNDLITYLIRPR